MSACGLSVLADLVDEALRPLRNRHFLVLPRKQLAFGRIPKAANSSVKRALHQLEFPRRDVARIGKKINRDGFWARKAPERAFLATPAQLARLEELFVFALVRSPFERLLSCYRDKIAGRSELQPALAYTGFRLDMGFEEFAWHACSVGDRVANNHLRSQFDMLSFHGRLLPQRVCRVEHLERDWRALSAAVRRHSGCRLPPLAHRNRSPAGEPSLAEAFRDPALVRAVRRRYAADFDAFYPWLPDPR